MTPHLRAGRVADHELRLEHNAPRDRHLAAGEGFRLIDKQVEGGLPHRISGLPDRGERDDRGGGEFDVVIADDRDVLRYSDAATHQALEQTDGKQIVRGKYCVGSLTFGPHADLVDAPPA